MRLRALALVGALLAGTGASGARAADPVWVPTQPVQTGAQDRLAALPDGTVWAVVDHSRILRSTDAGLSWIPVNPVPVRFDGVPVPMSGPTHGGFSDTLVAPESASVAMVADGMTLSLTRDGGVTWLPLSSPYVTRSKRMEESDQLEHTGGGYWLAKRGFEWVDGCPYPTKTTPLLASSDGGTWRRTDMALPGGRVMEVRFADAAHGAATVIEYVWAVSRQDDACSITGVGEDSVVFVTSDAGRHWRRVRTCKPLCYGLSWSTRDRLVVAQADGRVEVSKDDGETFRQIAPVPVSPAVSSGLEFVQALDCIGTRCWASVNGGGVFRHDGSGEWYQELSNQTWSLALGDLAAIDRERAVAGGPTALWTRVAGATAPVAHRRAAALQTGLVRIGPDTTIDAFGVVRTQVTLTR